MHRNTLIFTTGSSGTAAENRSMGITFAIAPVMLAADAVIVCRKRRKKLSAIFFRAPKRPGREFLQKNKKIPKTY